MRIINVNPDHTAVFLVLTRPKRGDWRATVVVKAAYRLVADGTAVADKGNPPVASGNEPADSCLPARYSSDFAPYKPKTDFLVAAAAHAPGGQSADRCRVSIAAGDWTKTLLAFGDRRWVAAQNGMRIGDPAPFTSLPIGYDRAFGGPKELRNPIGCGAERQARVLPNLEQPDKLISQPTDRPDPAGFGPIGMMWQPRMSKVGSYGDAWLTRRWPWFPDDFDWSFFNAAPDDQQFPFFHGDEALAFENLHAAHAHYRTRLPGVRARVFMGRIAGATQDFEELAVKLDTVWADLEAEQLMLLWRGTARVASPRLREIATICAALEPLGLDLDSKAHQAVFETLQSKSEQDPGDAAAALAKERGRSAMEQIAAARDQSVGFRSMAADLNAATGLDTWRERARLVNEEPMAALDRAITALKAVNPSGGQRLADRLAEMDRKLGDVGAAQARKPAWTRERVAAALAMGESLSKARLDGLDLEGLDFSGADLRDATLKKTALVGAKFDGANLAGADLSKSTLVGATFAGAELARANLQGAMVTGASFAAAGISGTNFTGLDLTGIDFGEAAGERADFTEATLDGSCFVNALLREARFTAVSASGADFTAAVLSAADFSGARAPGILMPSANLTNLRAARGADFSDGQFANARAPRSIWQGAKLDGASFAGAVLTAAQFPEASLREAEFDRASLETANLDDAMLAKARFTNANLLRTSFERADLTDAVLDGSNLYSAGFLDAVLAGATFDGSFVAQTQLEA